ncbi:terminase large subunit domain-containing protein [Mycobacterium angelicum]|uniref:Terminase n=1 Tax=Mycobacterium angelicum TaxID=470074 RepID=A0A1X0A184_MYCAN|nr:terminase large subunit [Mycobacterium angelicum]MCV7195402.1 terminase [Mycobacterium angelicum]ORA23833.1 terminase [Mycobacterium angelicum]
MRLKPVDASPLPWRPRGTESERFRQFCKRFLKVPKGHNAGKPVILRDWQIDLVSSVMDADPRPRLAGWMIGRGNGKSSLLACWALYELFTGPDGGHIVVCARNQKQATILFNVARMMVQRSPELYSRCQVMKESVYYPRTLSTLEAMPSEAESLEGLDFSLALVDELQVVPQETVSTLMLAQGKRPISTLVGIGNPPAEMQDSPLVTWRNLHRELGDDFITWREFSADEFQHHDMLCDHCIELSNPAYGDFLSIDVFERDARTVPENDYRRKRLCQFVESNESPFLTADAWDDLSTGEAIKNGTEVVLSLDGSFGGSAADSTALVVGTVSATPHFDLLNIWEGDGSPDFRIDVLAVEDAIRQACRKYNVRELVADPFRWNRTLQVLAQENIPVAEFPWSPSRATKAVADVYSAAMNKNFTHSGNDNLRRHVLAAKLIETNSGITIDKSSRRRKSAKIDAIAALIMCNSRCVWLGTQRPKKNRAWAFR